MLGSTEMLRPNDFVSACCCLSEQGCHVVGYEDIMDSSPVFFFLYIYIYKSSEIDSVIEDVDDNAERVGIRK